MSDFVFRNAGIKDIPFLVDTIVEAEKSGSDKFSYSTVFGLSEAEARKCMSDMLLEEIDGCELSVSSFLIAEKDGKTAAAVGAWIEGLEGIPSTVLKGNLLSYTLPKEALAKALSVSPILKELHIEYISDTIQIGLVYVSPGFRGLNLVSLLINEQIGRLCGVRPGITEAYVQVFGNNFSAIKAYEKAQFKTVSSKECSIAEISDYLPFNKKIVMKKSFI